MEEGAAGISIEAETLQVGAVYYVGSKDKTILNARYKYDDGETEHVQA
jgi:hypothetical protein